MQHVHIVVAGQRTAALPVQKTPGGALVLDLTLAGARELADLLVERAARAEMAPMSGAEAVRLVTGGGR